MPLQRFKLGTKSSCLWLNQEQASLNPFLLAAPGNFREMNKANKRKHSDNDLYTKEYIAIERQ